MMKILTLQIILFFSVGLFAQCPKYDLAIEQGKEYIGQEKYDEAIIEFKVAQLAARTCGKNTVEPNQLLTTVFRKIQSQQKAAIEATKAAKAAKAQAEQAERSASVAAGQAKKIAIAAQIAKENTIKEENLARKATATAQIAQKQSDSLYQNISRTNQRSRALVEGVYFYNNNIGVAYDSKQKLFYYFDTLGQSLFNQQFFKSAQNFKKNGLALVETNTSPVLDAFIDTTGQLFHLATGLEKLRSETVFINLQDQGILNLKPAKKGTYFNVKALDASGNNIYNLKKTPINFPNIETLNLDNNNFAKLPNNIGEHTKLRVLTINNFKLYNIHQLSSLPDGIGNLSQLEKLEVGYHHLSKLPKRFSHLQNLETLSLSNNQFKKMPSELTKLSNLKVLDMSNNRLKTIPNDIRKLQHLEILNLSANPLSDSLVQSLRDVLPNTRIIFEDSRGIVSSPSKLFFRINIFGETINIGESLLLFDKQPLGSDTSRRLITFKENGLLINSFGVGLGYQKGDYGIFLNGSIGIILTSVEIQLYKQLSSRLKLFLGYGIIPYINIYSHGIPPWRKMITNQKNDNTSTKSYSHFSTEIDWRIGRRYINNIGIIHGLQFKIKYAPNLKDISYQYYSNGIQVNGQLVQPSIDTNINASLLSLSLGYYVNFGRRLKTK